MSRRISYYGIFAALAVLMGYVEAMVPVPVPIPGIKLGLSNVIVLLALYIMDARAAFFISVIRVLISGLLFRGFIGVWYSLSGAFLSFLVMYIGYRTKKLSIIGISVLGGIFHNLGQVIVAVIMLGRAVIIYLLPVLMLSGVATGFMIGVISGYTLKYLQRHL